jgi:hypothetical protein
MTTAEVATQLITLIGERKFMEAIDSLYADDVVSLEARGYAGLPRELRGREQVRGKNAWWLENNEVHAIKADGPFLSPEKFAVVYWFDRTFKNSGERSQFTEVAIYTVTEGKIVSEEFLFAPGV